MTTPVLSRVQPLWKPKGRATATNWVAVACCYVTLYVALDWISYIEVLPGSGYTPWNPPPALSLALIARKGLSFAPAIFVGELASTFAVTHFPTDMWASLVSGLVVAVGYTSAGVALRRIPLTNSRPIPVDAVVSFLAVAAAGALVVAVSDVSAMVALNALPARLAERSIQDSFIGDLTGILGLLPALLTWRAAWDRWKEVSPDARVIDVGVYALLLCAALLLVFGNAHEKELQLFYLMLPPVIWIAVRHGLAWCAIAILIDQLALVTMVALLNFSTGDFFACQLLSIVISATGLILGAVVTQRHYAEHLLRRQQAELARHTRLTTVGAFGAAVVHEISQPLAAAAAFAHSGKQLSAQKPINCELLRETVENVEQETRRAGAIVERIRRFLDRGELQWRSIDLREVLRRLSGALADEARTHGVALRVVAPTSAVIDADDIQIEQVLANLMRNAMEAAAHSVLGSGSVQATLSSSSGSVRIEIEDNGPGVAPDIVERLFEPFETTKRRGVGLGLSLSREVAKAHGGRLRLDRTGATGSKFVLELPDKKGAAS
ncbi:MAG TPA: ATP-binding protein [Roseiarcus sp.]|nr:ATP-binding protein [Roseiarcus sp.]